MGIFLERKSSFETKSKSKLVIGSVPVFKRET